MSFAPKPGLAQKKSSPNIRTLQAAFESPPQQDHGSRHPHAIYPPNVHRSNAGDLTPSANMSSARSTSLTKSIDSILDTPAAPSRPASPPNRPLAKLRPSWIGPQPSKPTKADIAGHLDPAMKQRVSIEFASPGLQPPVYMFTSLSDPEWTATEMFAVKQLSGDFTFVRNFDVEEGEYQYKFRLGPGDWWVCDEKREIVDDGAGNRNNRVVVKAEEKKAVDSGHASPERDAASPKPASGLMPKPATYAEPIMTPATDRAARVIEPIKAAETVLPPAKDISIQQPTKAPETAPVPVAAPQPQKEDYHDLVRETKAPKVVHPLSEDQDFENEPEPYAAPLLRHESLSPSSHEQDHSPLFRHESIGLGYNHHEEAAPHVSSSAQPQPVLPATTVKPVAAREADPDDPALHPFPTDHESIMNHIQRTHTRLPEDQTDADVMTSSPASSGASTDTNSLSGVPSLPSVNEDEDEVDGDEELEKIRQAGEEEAEEEQENGEELDPLKEGEAAEAEDANFECKIPELKVIVVPKVEKEEITVNDRRPSLTEKFGTTNLMAIAVGLLAVIAAAAVVKMFR